MESTVSKVILPAAVALLSVAVTSLGAAAPAPPAPRGSILVSSTRAPDLHDELWLVDLRSGRRSSVSRSRAADRDPALAPDRGTLAFVSDRGGAEALWTSRPDGGGLRRVAGPLAEGSDELVRLLEPRWSPDGRRLAYLVQRSEQGSTRSEVRVVGRNGGTSTRIAGAAEFVTWSPDSRRLAITNVDSKGYWTAVYDLRARRLWRRSGALAGWSARGELALLTPGRARIAIVGHDGRVRRTTTGRVALWRPDGRRLAVGDERSVRILDEGGRSRYRSTRAGLGFGSSWSPDGSSLLVFDRDVRPLRLRVGSGPPLSRLPDGAAWRPDGTVAVFDDRGVSVAGRAPVPLLPDGIGLCDRSLPVDAHWVDRDRLLYAAGSGGQHMADLWIVTGRQARRLGGAAGGWRGRPAWSPDGGAVVYEHGSALQHGGGCSGPFTPHLRTVNADGSGVRVLTRPAGDYDLDPRWSPDGRHVAFARESLGEDTRFGIFVVDLRTEVERRLTSGRGRVPTWTADGRAVVYEQVGQLRHVSLADGSAATIAVGRLPQAAPVGQSIAFLRAGALWTIGTDGTGARRLGQVRRTSRWPAVLGLDPPRWSPDAKRIAVTDADGVLVFDLDGGVRRVPAPGAADVAWSPDGRTISFSTPVGRYSRGIFSSQYVERTELYTAPAGGGKPTRVTTDLANVLGSAAWRP